MRGAVMVEFALIVPIMVLLVFGITELGRGLYYWNTLTKAVATGARYMARSNGDLLKDDGSCEENTAGSWASHRDSAGELIVFGKTDAVVGTDEPLLLKLDTVPIIDVLGGELNYVLITSRQGDSGIYKDACVIEVEAKVPFDWMVGPLIPFDLVGQISLTVRTEERYIAE